MNSQPGVELGVLSRPARATRADLYKRNDVSSREGWGGGERRQSGALEKRLSAVKNAAELLVCLARYKRPGSWCAFRNKHAATARPPVLWRNPRSEKKERKKRSGKKPSTVLFFLFLHLLFWPSLASHNLVSVFRGLNLDKSFFLSFSFSKKVSFWRMFFTPENFSFE